MTQADLNRAVAQATGETITTIRELGFSEVALEPFDDDAVVIDWDALDEQRHLALLP